MPTSPNLGITHLDPAQANKTVTANAGTDSLDEAIAGDLELDCSAGGTITLTSSQWINMVLHLTGAPGGAFTIVLPATPKVYIVDNASGQTATVKTASGTGVNVLAGAIQIVRCDGTNILGVNAASSGGSEPYDLGTPLIMAPPTGQVVDCFCFTQTVTFPAGLSGSKGVIATAPSGASGEVFTLYKNGVSFGTATFAQGSTTATFAASSSTTFDPGDVLKIVMTTSPADPAFAPPGCITLIGAR